MGRSASPGEGRLQEDEVPVDFRAAPEGFDVRGVDGDGVDERADADAVAGWKEDTSVTAVSLSVPLCVSLSLYL